MVSTTKAQTGSPFANCVNLTDPTDEMGLTDGQRTHRYQGGPPVFASHTAYEIAFGPDGQNPNRLEPVCVQLKSGLTKAEYEDHYIRVFEMCKALEVRGIVGTGITYDASFKETDWRCYFAVFDPKTTDEVTKDNVVR